MKNAIIRIILGKNVIYIHNIIKKYSHFSYSKTIISLITLFLLLLGITLQLSVGGTNFHPYAHHHTLIAALSLTISIIVLFTKKETIINSAYHIYGLSIIFLLLVLIIGKTSMGATRWLSIAGISIQPSEFTKITLILALAHFFNDKSYNQISRISYLILPLTMSLIPILLILLQPNLGTATIIFLITTSIFFSIGVRTWKFVVLIISIAISVPMSWIYVLHDYQKKRVLMFLNPDLDPLGAGYNLLQSQIAIGSGGLWGKGLFSGTQNQLNFLPEKHTDFIFTILCEETGFIFSSAVIIIYMILISTIMHYQLTTKDTFTKIINAGVSSMIFSHLMINIGMITGIIPVVGVPLPFLSYGGSNMLASIIGISLVLKFNTSK